MAWPMINMPHWRYCGWLAQQMTSRKMQWRSRAAYCPKSNSYYLLIDIKDKPAGLIQLFQNYGANCRLSDKRANRLARRRLGQLIYRYRSNLDRGKDLTCLIKNQTALNTINPTHRHAWPAPPNPYLTV